MSNLEKRRDTSLELWKEIEGFPGYEISNYGNVMSFKLKEPKLRKSYSVKGGYTIFKISKEGKKYSFLTHHLVWDAFGNAPRNGRIIQVDHLDNDATNNHIDNLDLKTNRENVSKAYKNKKTTSKYTGVHFRKDNKKWVAKFNIKYDTIYLGQFDTEEEANEAYKKQIKKHE